MYDETNREIDTKTFISRGEFLSTYKNKRPVLIKSRGFEMNREEIIRLLKENYSNYFVNVGHATPLSIGGHSDWKTMTINRYLFEETFSSDNPVYVFDSNLLSKLPLIREQWVGSVNVSLLDVRYQCIENEKIEGCSDSSVNAKQSMHSINGIIDGGTL